MARIEIPITSFTRAGSVMPAPIAGDTLEGHALPNDGKTGLVVKNESTTTDHTVTIHLSRVVDGQSVVPRTETVPFGESHAIGPFPAVDYGNSVAIDVSSSDLKLSAVRVS